MKPGRKGIKDHKRKGKKKKNDLTTIIICQGVFIFYLLIEIYFMNSRLREM